MKCMAQLQVEGLVLTYESQSFEQQIQASTMKLNGFKVKKKLKERKKLKKKKAFK
jgi:hypothetical protein